MKMTDRNFGILGTGSYVPDEVVGNEAIARSANVSSEWISDKTGVHERRRAADNEAASDLATAAARRAISRARIDSGQLDYVVIATSTPDHPQPATASIVQGRLGIECAAFDLNAVCSGFIHGLAVADALLKEAGRYALVVAADVYSRILDYSDRKTAPLFGDGAGATVLGAVGGGRGLRKTLLISEGRYHDMIKVPAGGSRLPPSQETVATGRHYFKMDGRGVREFVSSEVPPVVTQLLDEAGVRPDMIDHFIPHQANGVMLRQLMPELGLDNARLHLTVDRFGNTGAASIPVTLDHACQRGEIGDGDWVLLTGFGGGMAAGAALLRWAA
jgi:3-oxoacyl-[acyl-carrier-protein] synthase-3